MVVRIWTFLMLISALLTGNDEVALIKTTQGDVSVKRGNETLAVQKGDVAGAAEILKEVLRNKPEKNKWSEDEQNETSNRAFYETGG